MYCSYSFIQLKNGLTEINIVSYLLLQIPESFGIVGTLDLLYKIHKIFDIEPHTHCKRLIHFLDFFVYRNESDIDDGFIDKAMHDLGDNLLRLSLK